MAWDYLPDELKNRVHKDSVFKGEQEPKKKSKYNNIKTEIDGIKFDSRKESIYYEELKFRKMAGEIVDFQMQVPYELQPGYIRGGHKIRPIHYIADFLVEYTDGHEEVIDVKSPATRTQVYKIKKKMLLYKYPELIFLEV